jgi:tRNA threonylcarbamoyladenosine biosynthesis protein TsaB
VIALALDTSAALAAVGLFDDGELIGEVTWRTHQNHSRELLPTVDWLLASRGIDKASLAAVCVCLGPGSYAGLRVGLSTAKGLAYGLELALVGVGRLAADAEPLALENGPPVYAVQAAGRAELAWAGYRREEGDLRELIAPALGRDAVLEAAIEPGSIACGEIPASLKAALGAKGVMIAVSPISRISAIGRLSAERLARGEVDDVDSLVPLYLREPAIGPQPPVPQA